MSLYKRGKVYHYRFGLNGKNYRGSTKAQTETKAKQVLKVVIAAAQQGQLLEKRSVGRLADFEKRFTKFIENSTLDKDTKRYYKQGWELLKDTPLAKMRLDRITRDQVDIVKFGDVSGSYANQARRTLRRMLGQAVEWNLLPRAPKIKLGKENRRHVVISAEDERALLAHMDATMKDAFIFIQDAGLRPEEIAKSRIEHINWQSRTYYNASGKSEKARRFVPLSDRLFDVLFVRSGDRKDGWLFPSKKKNRTKAGHVHPNSLSHWFLEARRDAGLPDSIVLYSGRHTFGTDVLGGTGNLAATMNVMGHTKADLTMRYQHPELEQVRQAINLRNSTNAAQAKEKPESNPAKSLN